MKYALFLVLILGLFSLTSAIALTTCSNISYSGSYTLSNDVSNNSAECFTIGASNVIFDCQSFNASSTPNFAFRIGTSSTCFSNITIKNCNMTGYGGLAISGGWTYSGGCNCGLGSGIKLTNNSVRGTDQGFSYSCQSGLRADNNTINLNSNAAGIGIYETFSGSSYYENMSVYSPLGAAIRVKYSSGSIFNHSILSAKGGMGIHNIDNGGEYIDYSIINASYAGSSFAGYYVLIKHSSVYINISGFRGSWTYAADINQSQIIASGTGVCSDSYAISSGTYIDQSNLTSENGVVLRNGNVYGGHGQTLRVYRSYLFSNGSYVVENGKNWGGGLTWIQDSIIRGNTTGISAIYDGSNLGGGAWIGGVLYYGQIYRNITIMTSNGTDIEDHLHYSGRYNNITFNGTGHPSRITIINNSNNMNFTSADLPFFFTADAGVYLNISSIAPYYANLQMYYVNETNESQYVMMGYDGVNITNVSNSALNTTLNYVNGTASFAGIFFIGGNGTAINMSVLGDCYYWGNCTIGTSCSDNEDCASGICYDYVCVDSGGCTGDGCSALPNIIDVIFNVLLGSAAMIKFLIALIVLSIGAYAGFRIGNTIGSIIVSIILLCLMAFLPAPLNMIEWWVAIVGIIGALVGAIVIMGASRTE